MLPFTILNNSRDQYLHAGIYINMSIWYHIGPIAAQRGVEKGCIGSTTYPETIYISLDGDFFIYKTGERYWFFRNINVIGRAIGLEGWGRTI